MLGKDPGGPYNPVIQRRYVSGVGISEISGTNDPKCSEYVQIEKEPDTYGDID